MQKSLYKYQLPIFTLLCILVSSCIQNDIPFPRIPQYILSLKAEGEIKNAEINDEDYMVTVTLDETVDIKRLQFSDFTFTQDAIATPDLNVGNYNLTRPLIVNISRYQTYQWQIVAIQNIEHYFTLKGQIGETTIDDLGRRIIVNMPESADLSNLTVESIKLGPKDITTLTPDLVAGQTLDLVRPLRVSVKYHDNDEIWTIFAVHTKQIVTTTSATAWSCVAWVSGQAPAENNNFIQYRESTSDEWINVAPNYITHNQGSFTAKICHLKPLTKYNVRAMSDKHIGNEITITTQATMDLPDGSFDQWWKDDAVWCPWDKNGTRYWDTGNTGAATLGQSNVYPSDYTPDGKGKSACLETRFVGVGPFGKLAAGSIYTGQFKKVDGTNGILDFGRPFNLRPTKLKGYLQYKTASINYASTEYKSFIGRPDTCHIYIALTDWSAPYEIRTKENNRQLFNSKAPYVIAYGDLQFGSDTNGYIPIEIELKYNDIRKVPSYIQITAAASKYGDYFTGGTGATLYVDQFSLSYDY